MWLVTVCVLLAVSKGADAVTCTTIDYSEVEEASYDRNYSRIDSEGKRPLGFVKGMVAFNDQAAPDGLCVKLGGLANRRVEVAFETVPKSTLCVVNQKGRGGCREAYKDCFRVTGDVMTLRFYCRLSEGCSESDVTFWYRLRRGPPPAEDTEGGWCDMQPDVVYPGSLLPPRPNFVPPGGSPARPVGAAWQLAPSLGALCTLLVLLPLLLAAS